MGVVDLAEGAPVHIVHNGGGGSFQIFLGNGIKVVACQTADEQSDDGGDSGDGLGLLVGLLVGQGQDHEGDEREGAYDHAHIVPQPEQELVLLAGGLDAVGFLPQLGANDHTGQIQHQGNDHLPQAGHKGPVDGAVQDQDRNDLQNDGNDPQGNRADAQAGGIANGSGFLSGALSGAGLDFGAVVSGDDLLLFLGFCHNVLSFSKIGYYHYTAKCHAGKCFLEII